MLADTPEPGLSCRPSTEEEVRPSMEEVLKARHRLTASSTFGRSRRLVRLLEFTIDAAIGGRADEIKESTLGSEVYDRGPDFDPRVDGIVRVEATRLRQKLAEYYQGAGQSDPIRIEYPKGSYVPTFRLAPAIADTPPAVAAAVSPAPEIVESPRPPVALRASRKLVFALLTVLSCLAIAGVVYWAGSRRQAFAVRPGVAVLSPVNLSGNQADIWLSTALRELLAAELSTDGSLRVPPGELVSRAERDWIPHPSAGLAPDTFSDLSRMLNVGTVLTGSYVIAGESVNRQIRVDLHIQASPNADSGEAISETGASDRLLDLTTRLGRRLRQRLKIAESSRASVLNSPATSAALPLYFQGLQRMRDYDPLGALTYLDRAVKEDPREPMSHLLRAQCLALLGRDPESRQAVARAFDLRGSLTREQQLRIEAEYYRLMPSYARAADVLRALITFYPDELDYRFQLVDAFDEAGQYRDSVAEIAAMRALPAPLNQDPRIDWADMKTAHKQTDFARRLSSARRLEAKARELHADWLLAEALTREAGPLAREKQIPQAGAAIKQAREICERLGDRECVAFSFRNEGTMLVGTGDVPKALEAFNRELAIGREIGSLTETANALNGIGVVRGILGDLPGARDALEQLLAMSLQRQEQFGIKMANLNLASVLLSLGDLAGAGSHFGSALELSRKLGESEGEAESLVGVGEIELLGGKPAEAIGHFEEAAAVARRSNNLQSLAEAATAIANAQLATHRLDLARPATLEANRLAEKAGGADNRIESQLTSARLAMEEGRFADAESALRMAEPLVDKNRSVNQRTRLAALSVELDLAQHRKPGIALEALKNIPAGTPMASALEARIVLGRATPDPATTAAALAEARRLGLASVERSAAR
jgi:tetratricopeptide (TPR) repeat protein